MAQFPAAIAGVRGARLRRKILQLNEEFYHNF
jgi:hypothetical protein